MSPGSELRMQSTTEPRGGNLEYLVGPGGVLTLSDDIYRNSIYQHKRRKFEEPVSVIRTSRSFELNLTQLYWFLIRTTWSSTIPVSMWPASSDALSCRPRRGEHCSRPGLPPRKRRNCAQLLNQRYSNKVYPSGC